MLLRKDDPWIADLPIPDIRNWRVMDRRNACIGFVETLAIESQDSSFEALYTGANERFGADEIEIGEHVIRISRALDGNPEAVTREEPVQPRFDDAFRDHFKAHVGNDHRFSFWLPAYRFGREMARDADFIGLPFAQATEGLEAHYAVSSLQPPFSEVRTAIQFGYELARGTRPV